MASPLCSPLRLRHSSASSLLTPAPSRSCTNAQKREPVQAALKTLTWAAVGGAVISTAVVMLQRQQQQARAGTEAHQRRAGGGARGGVQLDHLLRAAAAQAGFGFDWPSHGRDQKLLKTLHDIERRQHKEAVKELRRWDDRFSLRLKSLAELRAMAQKHGVTGRSKMRKLELVAALEAELKLRD